MASAEPTAKAGWSRCSLQEICEGKISDGTHQTPKYYDNGVIFLSSKNVTSGQIDWENIKYIDTKQHLEMHKRIAPRLGDILLAKNGTTGVAAIVDRDVTFDIYVSLALLRPKKEILPHLLLHFINSPIAKKQFNKRLKGVGVPNLHLKEIREVKIDFPCSLAEQERIVAILDEAFEGIAAATAQAEKNLHNARELFQSVLQSTFSQKGHDWVETTLGEACSKIGSGATPRGGKNAYKTEGISLIRSLNVYDREFRDAKLAFIDQDQADKLSNVVVEEGDVLLNITGASVARCCVAPAEHLPARVNQHVSIVRTLPGTSIPSFLNQLLTSKEYKDQLLGIGNKGGATRQAITKSEIQGFKVLLPPLSTQQAIVEKLDALSEETKRLETIYERKKAALTELKQSLLQKAFAGEL
jgi:type I restriction enzyme S subunit